MRTHLLTGAGSGIGAEVAARLLGRGDRVVAIVRSAARADELAAAQPGLDLVVGDLSDPASLDGVDLPESLDSLVHAAGVVDLGLVAELDLDAWVSQLTVNLVAPAALTRVALPALRATRGTVVFLNSGAGLTAHPRWAAYAASKHGLRALADALRAEEAGHGVRVSTIYPGRTATPMQARVHDQEGKEYDSTAWTQPGTVAEAVLHVLDLPRDATVTDLTVRPGG